MDIIFMNFENSKISEHDILLPNLADKINLKGIDKHVALSNLSRYYTWKNMYLFSGILSNFIISGVQEVQDNTLF